MSSDEERGEKKGVDVSPEQRARNAGAVDPTGHVSSGVQVGPLRGADEAPVASTDEAMRQDRPGWGPGRQLSARDPEGRRDEDDVTARYLKRDDEADE
ncbi:MAG TPA: hypothetical protein VFH78_02795 [Candidatus Thermoplasmatota archaeon]|nr:hypothetical protein [Candidatus Thermoplasmatota archaeon]